MAIGFAPVGQAAKAGVPNYVQAELQRARIDSANKQKEYQQKQNMLKGGVAAYNEFMGDDTPIKDGLDGVLARLRGSEDIPTGEMAGETRPGMGGGGMTGVSMDTPGISEVAMGGGGRPGMGDMLPELGMDSAMDMAGGPAAGAAAAAEAGANAASGAAESGADALDSVNGVPLISALRGVNDLAQGDIGGAAKTGASAYLSTLGPYGIAAGLLMNLLG